MSEFDKGLSPALVAAREHTRLVAKWGAFKVPGLDQHRAEAIGLKPLVKKIGYATPTQELPLNLRDPGNAARYIRRTAELLLLVRRHLLLAKRVSAARRAAAS